MCRHAAETAHRGTETGRVRKGQFNTRTAYHGQVFGLLVSLAQLAHLGEEHVGGGTGQVEPQDLQDQMLHPEDLPLVVGVVRDVDELPDIRRIDLLILGSNEHAGGSHQLELGPLDRHVGEEPVDVGNSQVESLGLQLVLLSHLHQPVHQDGPHGVADVGLLSHVVGLGQSLQF